MPMHVEAPDGSEIVATIATVALKDADGRRQWRVGAHCAWVVGTHQHVVCAKRTKLRAFALDSGDAAWTWRSEEPLLRESHRYDWIRMVAIGDGVAVQTWPAGADVGVVVMLDEHGTEVGRTPGELRVPEDRRSPVALVVSDGTVAGVGPEGRVRWSVDGYSPHLDGSVVIVQGGQGRELALDAASGAILRDDWLGSTIGLGVGLLYTRQEGRGFIQGVDPTTRRVQWCGAFDTETVDFLGVGSHVSLYSRKKRVRSRTYQRSDGAEVNGGQPLDGCDGAPKPQTYVSDSPERVVWNRVDGVEPPMSGLPSPTLRALEASIVSSPISRTGIVSPDGEWTWEDPGTPPFPPQLPTEVYEDLRSEGRGVWTAEDGLSTELVIIGIGVVDNYPGDLHRLGWQLFYPWGSAGRRVLLVEDRAHDRRFSVDDNSGRPLILRLQQDGEAWVVTYSGPVDPPDFSCPFARR